MQSCGSMGNILDHWQQLLHPVPPCNDEKKTFYPCPRRAKAKWIHLTLAHGGQASNHLFWSLAAAAKRQNKKFGLWPRRPGTVLNVLGLGRRGQGLKTLYSLYIFECGLPLPPFEKINRYLSKKSQSHLITHMENRKNDHLDLAFSSRVDARDANPHFYYEPLLSAHPQGDLPAFAFAGKTMRLPVWVSSMTGGGNRSGIINQRLAQVCRTFGMGLGLGSCRLLLDDDRHFSDYDVRSILGDEQPLYANLGICQLEKMIDDNQLPRIDELVTRLRADGIIIHINPLQEAFQPEGDVLHHAPVDLLDAFLKQTRLRVIVKEVGQGMGPESLRRLMQMPLQAIEFGALGGTNFSLLELMRHSSPATEALKPFVQVGHTADEMLAMIQQLIDEKNNISTPELIISGGISSPLHGWQLVKSSPLPSVFGMGAPFLQHANESEEALHQYVGGIEKTWQLADAFLRVKEK